MAKTKKPDLEVDESIAGIDKDQLDVECENHSERYLKYAKLLAKAKKIHEDRKTEKELALAECDQEIRSDPDGYGLTKTTEASIKAAVLEHAAYQKANKRLISAKYDMDVLDAAVKALEHRKQMLENLVYLHGQSYFASPRDRNGEMKAKSRKRLSDKIRYERD